MDSTTFGNTPAGLSLVAILHAENNSNLTRKVSSRLCYLGQRLNRWLAADVSAEDKFWCMFNAWKEYKLGIEPIEHVIIRSHALNVGKAYFQKYAKLVK